MFLTKGIIEGNFLLSIERKFAGRQHNFSFVADFKDDHTFSFPSKSQTETISLSYEVDNIKLVKFYSNSTSSSTFYLLEMVFEPIYKEELNKKDFFPMFASGHYYPPMSHKTWYTLDYGI